MVFRVLDATAFYAGIPFASNDSFMTTSMVYEEIQHIKTKQGVLEMLQQTNRLQIRDPIEESIISVTRYRQLKQEIIQQFLNKMYQLLH